MLRRRSGESIAVFLSSLFGGVVADELKREVEAAGAHELGQRLDTRRDHALLPASNHRAVATCSLGQIRLRQSGAEPCLS